MLLKKFFTISLTSLTTIVGVCFGFLVSDMTVLSARGVKWLAFLFEKLWSRTGVKIDIDGFGLWNCDGSCLLGVKARFSDFAKDLEKLFPPYINFLDNFWWDSFCFNNLIPRLPLFFVLEKREDEIKRVHWCNEIYFLIRNDTGVHKKYKYVSDLGCYRLWIS